MHKIGKHAPKLNLELWLHMPLTIIYIAKHSFPTPTAQKFQSSD